LRLDQSQTETDFPNNLVKLSHEYSAAQDGHSSDGRGCALWTEQRANIRVVAEARDLLPVR
jgi:hypothetical protein